MIKKTQKANQGWQNEATPQEQPADTVRDLFNMRITNLGGGSWGVETLKGNRISFSVNPKYTPYRMISAMDKIVCLSTNAQGNGEIGITEIDEATNIGTYTPLYNHLNLAFDLLFPAYGVFNRESPDIQRCYWWDDKNPPRCINVVEPVYTDYFIENNVVITPLVVATSYMVVRGTVINNVGTSIFGPNEVLGTVFVADGTEVFSVDSLVIAFVAPEVLELAPSIQIPKILFNNYLTTGGLYNGVWSYIVCVGDGNAFSPWLYLSRPIHITESMPGNFEDYHLYQGQGPPSNLNTAKGIQLKITGIDTNFTVIRIAAIHSTALNISDPPVLVAEETITGSTMLIDHTDPSGIQALTFDEVLNNNVTILHNKTGTLNQNYLFLGKPTLRDEPVFDPSTAVVSPCFYDLPTDTTDYVFGKHPDDTVALNVMGLSGHDTGISYIYVGQWYKVTGGAVTYNAVVYAIGDVFQGVVGVKTFVGPGTVRVILHIQNYTGNFTDIDITDDWKDHKGMAASAHLRSLWREETYREGVILWDLVGNPTYVHWMKDIKMPAQMDTLDDNHNPISGGNARILKQATTVAPERQFSIRVMGIKIDGLNLKEITDNLGVALADLPKYFRGFSIVRAPREQTIMGQGLLWPVVIPAASAVINPMGPIAMNWDWRVHDGIGTGRRKENYYAFYSPDFLLRYNNLPNKLEGDKLKIVDYLHDDDPGVAIKGTRETIEDHWYFKYFMPGSVNVKYTSVGIENAINPNNSREIEIGETNVVITPSLKFNNIGSAVAAVVNGGVTADGRGARKMLLNTREVESVAATEFEFGYGVGIDATTGADGAGSILEDRPLVNYIRPRSNLYGGPSASAKAATEYISQGHYQAFDTAFMAHLIGNAGIANDIEVYGGDCFIGIWDVAHLVKDEDAGGGKISYGLFFPVESNTNFNLREGRHLGPYRSFPNANGIAYGTGSHDKPEAFVYNPAYSSDLIPITFPGLPVVTRRNILEHTWYYSLKKQDGEILDNFRIIKQANFQNVDAALGPITAGVVKDGKLFCLQSKGVCYLPVNEKESIANTLGTALNIGTGGVMPRYDNTDDYYGSDSQSSVIVTESGFVFFDFRRRTFCNVTTGNPKPLSVFKGIRADLIDRIKQSTYMDASPFTGIGISGVYDGQRKHAIMSFKQLLDDEGNVGEDFTIILDVLNGEVFAGRTGFASPHYVEHNDKIYSIRDRFFEDELLENTDYALYQFVTQEDVLYMCILAYNSGSPAVAPLIDTTHWIPISAANQVWIHEYGDVCKFYGLVQQAFLALIINFPEEKDPIAKMVNNFEYNMSPAFWDDIKLENSWQTAQDIAIDIVNNREYEFRNRMWHATAPQDDNTGKMTDLWCKITMRKNNLLTSDPTISKNELIKFVSLVTYLEISE